MLLRHHFVTAIMTVITFLHYDRYDRYIRKQRLSENWFLFQFQQLLLTAVKVFGLILT